MQITQNLKLKQSQSLVMTPQLQQAIKLLQLNNLELSNLINKELEENPFLEDQTSDEEKNDYLFYSINVVFSSVFVVLTGLIAQHNAIVCTTCVINNDVKIKIPVLLPIVSVIWIVCIYSFILI